MRDVLSLIQPRLRKATSLTLAGIALAFAVILFLASHAVRQHLWASVIWILLLFSTLVAVSRIFQARILRTCSMGDRPWGAVEFRILTRYPYTSALILLLAGSVVNVFGYLYLKAFIRETTVSSFQITVILEAILVQGAICLFFLTKRMLMPLYRRMVRLELFRESESRFRASLHSKFNVGVVGLMSITIIISALFGGLVLQNSIRERISSTALKELENLKDTVSFVLEMNPTEEDTRRFIETLKLGTGGTVSLKLPDSKGGGLVGPSSIKASQGDIRHALPLGAGAELRVWIPEKEFLSSVRWAMTMSLVILLIQIGFIVFIIRLILEDIQQPLDLLNQNAKLVGEGRIDAMQPIFSDDEMEDLARGFEGMVENLRKMVVQIRTATKDLGLAAGAIRESADGVKRSSLEQKELVEGFHAQISHLSETSADISASSRDLSVASESTSSAILQMAAAIQQINQSMDSLLLVVEGITASITDLDNTINNVGKNVESLGINAEQTKEFAENLEQSTSAIDDSVKIAQRYSKKVIQNAAKGMELVSRNREKMNIINNVVNDFFLTTQTLLQLGKDIVKIVDYIENHSNQTNILALNAAIVASQSGDQGKAFSVVAEEIKTLSEQTVRSTREIMAIIETLQREIENAYQQVGKGLDAVKNGTESVAQSEAALQEILDSIGETDSVVESILNETLQQAGHASLIHEANRNIHSQVEAIRRVMGEQQQTSHYILSLALNVQETTSVVRDSTREQSTGADEIAKATEQVRTLASDLHQILAKQQEYVTNLKGTMNQVLEKAQENEKGVQNSNKYIDHLNMQVYLLNREVGRFKL